MSEGNQYSSGTPPVPVPFYNGSDYAYHNDQTTDARLQQHEDNHEETTMLDPSGVRPLHLAEKAPEPRFRSYKAQATAHSAGRSEKIISRSRLAIRLVTLAASLAVVGLLAHAITVYNSTASITEPLDASDARVSVWPAKVVFRPTFVLLGAAAAVSLVSIALVLLSISRDVRHMTKLGNTLNLCASVLELGLWVGSVAYYKSWDGGPETYDLLDWTCKRVDFKFESINFGSICVTMRFVWIMGIVLAVFELLNVLALFYWHFIGKKHARAHQYERT